MPSPPAKPRRPGSRSLAQAEVLRALGRVFPDPLIELTQIARTLTAGPEFDAQLDAWAAKWHLEELREVAQLHVYYWAGTPAAEGRFILPSTLPLVILRDRPPTLIDLDVEWSPPVIWQPLEQLDPGKPLDPPLAHPDHGESQTAFLVRAKAHYRQRAHAARRPRQLGRHAEWFVRAHVQGWTGAQIEAAIAATTTDNDDDAPDISTILRAVREFTKLLSTPDRH